MTKPVVHFIGDAEFFSFEVNGEPFEIARVYGIDHPKLGRDIIRTSAIVAKNPDGSFETLNTLYKPNEI